MSLEAENKILREMVKFAEGHVGEVPYWFDAVFTNEEFGDEILSCQSWWEKKKEALNKMENKDATR